MSGFDGTGTIAGMGLPVIPDLGLQRIQTVLSEVCNDLQTLNPISRALYHRPNHKLILYTRPVNLFRTMDRSFIIIIHILNCMGIYVLCMIIFYLMGIVRASFRLRGRLRSDFIQINKKVYEPNRCRLLMRAILICFLSSNFYVDNIRSNYQTIVRS